MKFTEPGAKDLKGAPRRIESEANYEISIHDGTLRAMDLRQI
jgi:hypothetical protein